MELLVRTTLVCQLLASATALTGVYTGCLCVHDATDDNQTLKIEPYGANSLRIRAVPSGGVFRDDLVSALVPPSDGIWIGENGTCTEVSLTDAVTRGAQSLSTSNGNLMATIASDGRLTFTRVGDSKVLLSEQSIRVLAPAASSPPLPGFYSLSLNFTAVDGERIYGLGQHKTGKLDYKGAGSFDLSPHNTEILIPVAHSSLGYAFLLNLPSFGKVEFSNASSSWEADTVLQADFWVSTTSDEPPHTVSPWAQLQGSYANATGHAPVYPEWTSGFWQCKNRYHNQSQILDVTDGYIQRGYPIQLIIIDYYSWSPGPLGDEVLPQVCWPDPQGMVEELQEKGVELMISPYFHAVQASSKYYADAAAKNYLALGPDMKPVTFYDNAFVYDLFQPEARAYAFSAVKNGYIEKYGIHHWWLDCDEPCGGDITKVLYNNGSWPGSFVGAAYPHMLDQMVWEGMTPLYPEDNVMLGRSAWAGTQRFGGAVWSGDTSSSFESLNEQFRAGLNMVMSGIPYWTTDIGGYAGGNISSPEFRELIVRWFQWGAFCPIFRLHGRRGGGPNENGGNPACGATESSNEIWNFGNESEAAIAAVMRRRDQMRPYIMEQYSAASESGTPVMRPLFFDFWEDAKSQSVDDEMMFGPDYLLAPQLNQNTTSRSVYLPPLPIGQQWRNVFTDTTYNTSAGGITISEDTPLTGDGFATFPLYYRYTAPPPPPPPPTPPKCTDKCSMSTLANSTDGLHGHDFAHFGSDSALDCCQKCVSNSNCTTFVWGLFDTTSGDPTCFFLGPIDGVKQADGRTFGCVRSSANIE